MMSGNNCWNKNVFSRWRKVAIEGDDWTWTGKVFQTIAAATGNERQPMVVRRYDKTNSSSVDDDRRQWWPGRSDMGTSWFKYASVMPCWTRYAISASLKFTRSRRRSQRNIARTSRILLSVALICIDVMQTPCDCVGSLYNADCIVCDCRYSLWRESGIQT